MDDVESVGGPDKAQGGLHAEEAFIAQMKHRRAKLDLSQGELSERVAALGGHMYQQTIAKLESGQRSLKLSEAEILARALGTTIQEMLSSVYGEPPWARTHMSRDQEALAREVDATFAALKGAEIEEHEAAEREAACADSLRQAQHAAVAAQHALQAARERHMMLAERYQHYAAELARWRELEERTGKRHRPRKRGSGFVTVEEARDGETGDAQQAGGKLTSSVPIEVEDE